MVKNLNSKNFFLLLLLASIYLFFAFNSSLYITDSVESNYALTAKEMVLSKDWLSPQIYGHFWYDKPIFFYWQTATAFKLFGFHEFAARLCPAVMGVLSLLLMVWFGRKLFPGRSTGLLSALILGTSFEFWVIAKFVITDMTLFFFFNGALACFLLAYRGGVQDKNYYYLFYLFCGLATLTKGPIGFMLPGLIILVFLCWTGNWSELKRMKIIPGVLLFFAVAVPWYFEMYLKHGQAFIRTFFGVHNYLRATVSEHPRDNVFYYYFAILLIGFFPWVAFLPQTIKNLRLKGKWFQNMDTDTKFLMIWIVVVFMFFELMATKYSTYTFAILFPLSLLTARFLDSRGEKPAREFLGPLIFVFLFILLLVGAAYLGGCRIHYPLFHVIPLALIALISFGFCFYFVFKKTAPQFLTVLLATILLFNGMVIKTVLIPASQYQSAKNIAIGLRKIYRSGDLVTSYGSYQTSAAFYSGGKIYDLTHRIPSEKRDSYGLSWASKYVMPTLRLEDIPYSRSGTRRIFVMMHWKDYQKFLKEYPGFWKIVQEQAPNYLVQKMSK